MYYPPQPSSASSSPYQPRLYQHSGPLTAPPPPFYPPTPIMSSDSGSFAPATIASSPSPFAPSTPSTSTYHAHHPPPHAQQLNTSLLPAQRPYMSPQLTSHFDTLTTSSPGMYAQPNPVHQQQPPPPPPQQQQQHITILEYGPDSGAQGSHISIKCEVNFPSPAPSPGTSPTAPTSGSRGKALRVVFGQHPVQTSVQVLAASPGRNGGQICQLTASAPSWSNTGGASMGRGNRVPVYIQVLAENHAIVESAAVGEFSYVAMGRATAPTYPTYSPATSLKRAGESLESHRPSPSQFLHRRMMSNGPKIESPEVQQYAQMGPGGYASSPQLGEPSSAYSSPYIQSNGQLPNAAPNPAYSPNLQPSLMRSTQFSAPTPAPAAYVPSPGGKACLELQGSLTAMSKGWTQDEWHARRRLVQFWRRQDGTTIFAAFRPLPQSEYPAQQNSIIISCIFREDKNMCYVTSVDTIYLLEALVGTRFTVEEKNRIRRNLEGFRPMTVSKKAGSEDFFKLIMGFPNPKPRNIEKDVKVFAWDILEQALKKIIGKYSASYPYPNPMQGMGPPTLAPSPPAYGSHQPPQPLPIQQPPSLDSSNSSVPTLVSHASSDSSVSYQHTPSYSAYSQQQPQTPSAPSPGGHYRHQQTTPQHHTLPPVDEKYHPAPSTSLGEGYTLSPSNSTGFWGVAEGGGGGGGGGTMGGGGGSASYGSLAGLSGDMGLMGGGGVPGGDMGVGVEGYQLPHVHETIPRAPSSNDLRVVYGGMAQS